MNAEDLYRIRMASDPRVSPDGRRVAYVVTEADRETDRNRSRVWVVEAVGDAESVPLTSGPADSQPRWSPDGRWLAFVSKRSGHDRAQLWLLPTAGGEPRRLTELEGGASSPTWSPDGTSIAFLSFCRAEGEDAEPNAPFVVRRLGWKADGAGWLRRRPQIFVADLDGAVRQITSGDGSAGPPVWSPDGSRLAFAGTFEADPDLRPASCVYMVEAGGGSLTRLTDGQGQAAAPTFTPDGSTVVYAGAADLGVGHTSLFRVPVVGGPAEELAPGFDRNVMVGATAYPGAPPAITPDGQRVLFCARDRGVSHLYEVPVSGGAPVKVVGEPDTSVSGLSLDAEGRTMALIEADPASPGEVAVFDPGAGTLKRRTRLGAAVHDGREPPRFEPRTFRAPDGVEIHGWVLRPAGGSRPGPLLLDIHGGPHNAWSPVFDGVHLYHHMLAEQGWTILIVNPRGSDGYGETFYSALVEEGWGQADVQDFICAVDALVAEGVTDPGRVAVAGYSYGGYMTARLTSRTDRFAAAVAGGVVVDLVSWTGSFDIGEAWASSEMGAIVADGLDRLLAQSPITEVGKVRTPTLVLHGAGDDRCPVTQAEQWFSALRSQGVESELVLYPGASHLFIITGRPSHRVDYNRRIFDWLSAHVPA